MPDPIERRATDERYLSQKELRLSLGLSTVDQLWIRILHYRSEHSLKLQLLSVQRKNFRLTNTDALRLRYDSFEQKLGGLANEWQSLGASKEWKEAGARQSLLPCLTYLAAVEGCSIGELSLKAMLNGQYRESNPDHASVLVYKNLLREFLDGSSEFGPDDSYAAHCLSSYQGGELTSFYRSRDYAKPNSQTVLGRNYDYAPFGMINDLMDPFWIFVSNPAISPFVRAAATVYYFDYVKPFDAHNEALGILLGKKILADAYGEAAALIPLEKTLIRCDRLSDYSLEAQRANDVTYFVTYAIDVLTPEIENLLNRFVLIKRESLKAEIAAPEPEPEPKPEPPKTPQKPVEVEVAPPSPKPVDVEEKEDVPLVPSEGIALVTPKATLSDKEIKETARYIIETNPSIRKTQALFFASHCTLGRYYTIQDYKKFARCAYETARTSMDHLAREGFYRKMQIKNKFVYTPIKQGE